MAMIPSQPFEVADFTGGLTDNFIQGKPSQYMRADNFILTTDGKLATRPGSVILDDTNYRLPDALHARVDFLGGWIAEGLLLAQSSQSLYALNPNWGELLGPTGNPAFSFHGADSKISTGEWSGHYYLAPDSGTFPLKLYKDANGVIQLRTAGLPQPAFSAPATDINYLATACALANELKSKMIAHFQDWDDGVVLSWQHSALDSANIAALTAAPIATTLATLITLTAALKTAHNSHVGDALLDNPNQLYHLDIKRQPSIPGAGLGQLPVLNFVADAALDAPTTLDTAIACLNDLRNRYNWHTWATLTHINAYTPTGFAGDNTGFGGHATNFVTIQNAAAPIFAGQDAVVLQYVNALKAEFNLHCAAFPTHNNIDATNPIIVPDATDLWGVVTILSHLEYFYWKHFEDANYLPDLGSDQIYSIFTGDVASGDARIQNISINTIIFSAGPAIPSYFVNRNSAQTTPPYTWAYFDVFFPSTYVKVISVDSATQVTMSAVASITNNLTWCMSFSKFHYSVDSNAEAVTSPTLALFNAESLDLTLTTLQSYIDAGVTFITKLKAHEISGGVVQPGFLRPELFPYSIYYSPDVFDLAEFTPHLIGGGPGSSSYLVFPLLADTSASAPAQYLHFFDTDTVPDQVSYLYTLVWRYDYTQQSGTSFENISTPSLGYAVLSSTSAPNVAPFADQAIFPITLTNLPALTNTGETNYDTAAIVLDIYRTIGNGDTWYLAGTVANGVTTFVDTSLDSILITNLQLYTTGGVAPNDQPPVAEFMTILNVTGYFANVVDTGQQLSHRVRQSNANSVDSCPATFFDDLDEAITGLNSVRNNVVAFGANGIYRIEGFFDLRGQGGMTHERISSTIGAVNNAGIVKTEDGLFFAGNDGFYFTDGFQFAKLSGQFDSYYRAIVATADQRARISGTYDKIRKRLWWATQMDPTGPYADSAFVLHLNFGIKADAVFTTASNSFYFNPTSILFFNNTLYRGDPNGYVFKHDDTVKTDPKINTAVAATSWQKVYMPWAYDSCAVDFGTTFVRKWVPKIGITAKNVGNVHVRLQSENDNGKNYYDLTPLFYDPNPMWGQPDVIWGTMDYRWKYDGQLDQWRRFVAGSLRCQFKQVKFSPAYEVVYASETYANALVTVDATLKTATITTPSGFMSVVWPLDIVDYFIAFQSDGYVLEYAITALDVTNKIATFTDASNTSTNGTMAWEIRGYMKEAALSLTSYVLHWAPLGLSQQAGFHGADTGENT